MREPVGKDTINYHSTYAESLNKKIYKPLKYYMEHIFKFENIFLSIKIYVLLSGPLLLALNYFIKNKTYYVFSFILMLIDAMYLYMHIKNKSHYLVITLFLICLWILTGLLEFAILTITFSMVCLIEILSRHVEKNYEVYEEQTSVSSMRDMPQPAYYNNEMGYNDIRRCNEEYDENQNTLNEADDDIFEKKYGENKAKLINDTPEQFRNRGQYIGLDGYVRYINSDKLVHRHVAEKYIIYRKLKDNEVVHHINGKKLDNRKENLKVMDTFDHDAYHNM